MRPDDPFVGAEEQLVVERDGHGLLEIRGWLPGPAGTAVLDLRGVSVELDVADAGALAAAVVTDSTRANRALAAMVGRERAAAITRAPNGLLVAAASAGRRRGRRRPNADHPATRLALIRLELADVSLSVEARAVALVEAAAAARLVGAGLGVGGAARRDAAAAAELLDAVDIDIDDDATDELAAACRAAAGVLDLARDATRADRLRRVAARLAGGGRRREPVYAAAMGPPPDAAAAAPARRRLAAVPPAGPVVDVGGLPMDVTASSRWRGPGELEVLVSGAPSSGWWARAVRNDGTPLAIVPLLGRKARMLLPPGAAAVVDVTHRPDVPPPSPARRAVEAALVAGVEACRAHRLRRPWEAADRWRSCAADWTTAGDDTRAGLASAYADGRASPRQPSRPLLVDRLR